MLQWYSCVKTLATDFSKKGDKVLLWGCKLYCNAFLPQIFCDCMEKNNTVYFIIEDLFALLTHFT